MLNLDYQNLAVSFIVVDNNSLDNTPDVIASFQTRLPLVALHQPIKGKSAALNLALESQSLGEIVVFTDDDVVPDRRWLQEIVLTCNNLSDVSVFGGQVVTLWPADAPSWVKDAAFEFVFCPHKPTDQLSEYPENHYPTGANFWVRRGVIDNGARFNVKLGASGSQAMGEDSNFICTLIQKGYSVFFAPAALVHHHAEKKYFNATEILMRAFRMGRSRIHKLNQVNQTLKQRHRFVLIMSLMKWAVFSGFSWCGRWHIPMLKKGLNNWYCLGDIFEQVK